MSSDHYNDDDNDGKRGADNRGMDNVDIKESADKHREEASLKRQPWYWPATTREEVRRRLAAQPDGTFLIREGSTPGELTLTVRESGSNKCIRVYQHEEGYSLSPTQPPAPFPSLLDLVDHYRLHSLASFNKRLHVCLSHPLIKASSGGQSQYSVFKELYDLSQTQLSAQTRLSVLNQQHSQLDQKVKLFTLMMPALRVVQQMYFDNMKLQEDWEPTPPSPSSSPSDLPDDVTEMTRKGEQTERLSRDMSALTGGLVLERMGDEVQLSKGEEKSFRANAHLLMARHSGMSDKLHSVKSNYDVSVVKLRDLEAELKNVELSLFRMKRRQDELIRQMEDMGCVKEFLTGVLETRVTTREFDRSMWLVDCTREAALSHLEGLPHGAFLIRHKDKRHLPYVLSIVVSGEDAPRTVQHCYIVRPHGRGYGFNPAMAVFQSIDQLVLRHRFTSLKHYFQHLDVTLTFPVGCQELLRRSMSDTQESLVVRKGLYANAQAIQEFTQGVSEPAGQSEEIELLDNQSTKVDSSSAGTQSRSDVMSTDDVDCTNVSESLNEIEGSLTDDACYTNVCESVKKDIEPTDDASYTNVSLSLEKKENKFVELSFRNVTSDETNNIPVKVKVHKYESVEFPSRIVSLYETAGIPETAKDHTCTKEQTHAKEHTYEYVDMSVKQTPHNVGSSQVAQKIHKYESIASSEKHTDIHKTKDKQLAVQEHKYDSLDCTSSTTTLHSKDRKYETIERPTSLVPEDVTRPLQTLTVTDTKLKRVSTGRRKHGEENPYEHVNVFHRRVNASSKHTDV